MNLIKISGKIIEKERIEKKDYINVLLAMPLRIKVYEDGEYKPTYSYIKFGLFGLDEQQYSNLEKGTFIDIIGTVHGNCDKNGKKTGEMLIIPRTITRGVLK